MNSNLKWLVLGLFVAGVAMGCSGEEVDDSSKSVPPVTKPMQKGQENQMQTAEDIK